MAGALAVGGSRTDVQRLLLLGEDGPAGRILHVLPDKLATIYLIARQVHLARGR